MLKMKIPLFLPLVLVVSLESAFAVELSSVPMQGGMVMPMIRYDAANSRLHVMLDPTVPQLTPLFVSHPSDDFNPSDPWYEALSPARQSRSFSRRYGFVIDAMSDPLMAGTQIWIRKISGSEGLGVYRYSNTEPKAFEPIFGTDGTTNALWWNGMMFHPAFTAPAGTNSYNAVFEAYLVDADTGSEIPNSGTGTFTFEWTNIPDGRPEIQILADLTLSWPATATNYVPEATGAVSGGSWITITNTPVLMADRLAVTVDPDASQQFFRMRRVDE
jgi:hypothetical protein